MPVSASDGGRIGEPPASEDFDLSVDIATDSSVDL